MSSPSPIAGNQYFSSVRNFAAPVPNLDASSVSASELTATSISANLYNGVLPGVGNVVQVVGYAPTEFSTLAVSTPVFLNTAPSFANATAVTSSQLLLLPNGAQVIGVTVTNNGTTVTGGTTYNVGTETWSAVPAGSTNLLAATPLASVNASVSAGTPPIALGTVGAPLAGPTVANATTGVSVEVLTTPNTAGDLSVLLTYLL